MSICTALLTTFLLFTDSRGFVGYPGPTLLANQLSSRCPGKTFHNDTVIGRGVFAPGLGTTTPPLTQLNNKLATVNVDACLLMLGGNDWNVAGITPEAVVDGMNEMGDACIADGAQVVIITGFPWADPTKPNSNPWVAEVRQRQMALGFARGWTVIDSWNAFDERDWMPCTVNGTTAADGIHPWQVSCRQQWADYVAKRLP